jgi:hypothetical protein
MSGFCHIFCSSKKAATFSSYNYFVIIKALLQKSAFYMFQYWCGRLHWRSVLGRGLQWFFSWKTLAATPLHWQELLFLIFSRSIAVQLSSTDRAGINFFNSWL